MKAAVEDQLNLLELQVIDIAIDQLEHKKKVLPQHTQIEKIKAYLGQLREAIVKINTIVADLEVAADKSEKDIAPVKERRIRNQQRIDDGSVPDAKTLNSLIEEVAHLERRIGVMEEEQLELMEKLEKAREKQEQFLAKEQEITQKLGEVESSRRMELKDLDAELDQRAAERAKVAANIEPALLKLYEQKRSRMGGRGAGRLANGTCSGCSLEANPSDLQQYLKADPEEIIFCEECDRILVRG